MDTTRFVALAALLLAACSDDHRAADDGSTVSREAADGSRVADAGSIDPIACVPRECAGMIGPITYFYATDCTTTRCSAKGGTLPLNLADETPWSVAGDCALSSINLDIAFRTTAGQVLAQNSQRDAQGSPWHETGAPIPLRCAEVARTAAPATAPETLVPVAADAGTDEPIADASDPLDRDAGSDAAVPDTDASACVPISCQATNGLGESYDYTTDCATVTCSAAGIAGQPALNAMAAAPPDGFCEAYNESVHITFELDPAGTVIAYRQATQDDGGLSPLGRGIALDCKPRPH